MEKVVMAMTMIMTVMVNVILHLGEAVVTMTLNIIISLTFLAEVSVDSWWTKTEIW